MGLVRTVCLTFNQKDHQVPLLTTYSRQEEQKVLFRAPAAGSVGPLCAQAILKQTAVAI